MDLLIKPVFSLNGYLHIIIGVTMSKPVFIKLICFSLVAIGLATLATQRIYLWTAEYQVDYNVTPVVVSTLQIVKLFLVCLFYFTLLLVLPVFAAPVVQRKKWNRAKFPALMMVLEVVLLVGALNCVPYDTISLIFCFIWFQPIALVNGIVWYRTLPPAA